MASQHHARAPAGEDTGQMIVYFCSASGGHRKQMSLTKFYQYYEPSTFVLNTRRDDGLWRYWRTKRSGKRVRVYQTKFRKKGARNNND